MTHVELAMRRYAISTLTRDELLEAIVRGYHAKIIEHAKVKRYRQREKQ